MKIDQETPNQQLPAQQQQTEPPEVQFQEQWAQLQSRNQLQAKNEPKPPETYEVTQTFVNSQIANPTGLSLPQDAIQTLAESGIRVQHQSPFHQQAEPIDPSTFRFDSEKMRAFLQEMKNPLPQKVPLPKGPVESLPEGDDLNLDGDDEYIPPDDIWG